MGETSIYPNKPKTLKYVIGAISLEVLWLMFIVFLWTSELNAFGILILIILLLISLLFGLGTLVILPTLFRTLPLFVLTEQGIFDHSQGKDSLFIPWSEITEVGLAPNDTVSITVRNPELLKRRLNPLQKFYLFFGSWATTNQPAIFCGLSTHSSKEICDLIIQYSEEYHRT